MKLLIWLRDLFSDWIFDGKFPYLPLLGKLVLFAAVFPLVGVYFFPADYRTLGKGAWGLLAIILAARPVAEILFDVRILRKLLLVRKEAGILCGTLALAHGWGYFLTGQIALPAGLSADYLWDWRTHFVWGLAAAAIALLLTLTSNLASVRLLRRGWKSLHRLAYLMFLTVTVHIAMVYYWRAGTMFDGNVIQPLALFVGMLLLWLLAALRVRIPLRPLVPFLLKK